MPALEQTATLSLDKVLLATDFSMSSEKAAAYCTGIARRFGSTVDVTYAFDSSVVLTSEEALLGLPVGDRTRMYDQRLRDICHAMGRNGVKSHQQLPTGHNVAKALLLFAESAKADLIITASRSKVGLERLILGSTAEKLIRSASCPVITIGPDVPWPAPGPIVFRRIVFATNLSGPSSKALPYALAFAEDSGAHLHLCMVIEDDSLTASQRDDLSLGFRQSLARLIPERATDWCTPECTVDHGEAAAQILALADRVNADLIVLGPRKASFSLSFLDHGLTPTIIAEAKCPVMTIS